MLHNATCSSLNYKHLFEIAPFGMVVISSNGKIQDLNRAFCDALGYEEHDLVGKNFKTLFVKEDFNRLFSKKDLLFIDKIDLVKVNLIKKDKSSLEVVYKNTLHEVPDGSPSQIIIQIVKMVNALQIDEVINKESNLFDELMESFPYEIFIKNLDSQFVKVNKANLIKLKQPSQEAVIGKTDFDFFNIKHAQKAFEDEQKILKTGTSIINIEEKELYPDGRVCYINTSKMPLLNKQGEIIGTFGISSDITKRKIHELDLKEKTSILNAITSKMPVVIFKFSKAEGLFSIFGGSDIKKAFEASKIAKVKIADGLLHFVDKIGSQKDKHGYFSFSSTSSVNRKFWYFENFIFEGHAEDKEIIGLALDSTDRKLIEQKLKRDAKDMEKVNRELNQFAYIISHDLKAPLRAITNLSEWIQEDLVDLKNPEVNEHLQLLRGRVERMENLINGILTYSRLTRAEIVFEKVEVGKLINEIADYLMLRSSFTFVMPENLPVLNYSKIHLEQIFTNLITNAIKHHDKGVGHITFGYKDLNGMHEFMVEDDGPGIAPEFHHKIFQIFQTLQARDALESTGIGLTIVKKIIEEQGGEIRIDSEEGKGCRFFFTIPKIKKNQLKNIQQQISQ